MRFSLKLAATLIVGFGIGAGWGWINGQDNRPVSAPFRITGLIDINPALRSQLKPTDVLFVIAAEPGGTRPIAAIRVSPVSLPYIYTLGPEHRMLPDEPIEPGRRFLISARIDRDGQADAPQRGDLVGQSTQGPVPSSARNVNVLIDTIVQ